MGHHEVTMVTYCTCVVVIGKDTVWNVINYYSTNNRLNTVA